MVETYSHAVGVVTSDNEMFALRLDLETVDGVGLKAFNDDVLRILRHHAVHQCAHGNDFWVGFLFGAGNTKHEA